MPVADIHEVSGGVVVLNVAERPVSGYAVKEEGTSYRAGRQSIRQKLNDFQEIVKNGGSKDKAARQKMAEQPEK